MAYYGVQGGAINLGGTTHLPVGTEMWGNDLHALYHEHLNCDITIIHRDIWVNNSEEMKRHPTLCWFPVDHENVGEPIVTRAAETQWRATMSRFGQNELRKAGLDTFYLPHSYNPKSYNPDGPHMRKRMGIPMDAYLIISVAANKGFPMRKGFFEMFAAVAELQKTQKDLWLYCHTNYRESEGGLNLHIVAQKTGCDMDRVRFSNPLVNALGMTEETMAELYRSANLYLSTAYGEGFGIPILEAQACGLPAVLVENSSQPELLFEGQLVRETYPFMTPHYGYMRIPRTSAIVEAIQKVRDGDLIITENSIKHFRDDYVWENYWAPTLKDIQAELDLMPTPIRTNTTFMEPLQ